ncbi:MAG: osmotically inducible protein OsmC [Candidatus Aegiribacteria sp.]|nr:osmotically inducible protein OsmC [Candidatus Aegiribacteria sp.]
MEMEIVFGEGKRVNARFGDFEIKTDQSVRGGGDASAPEPFDLFFASLGTCAGIYVLSFCQHHDLPSEGIKLVQKAVRNSETKLYETNIIEIQVPESFPKKYHKALVRSAKLCTVKRHVEKALPRFEVTLEVTSET